MSTLRFLLLAFALLIAASGLAVADDPRPKTDNWACEAQVDGGNVTLNLCIDNAADLQNYDGLVQKTWTNIALSNGAVIQELVLGLDGDPRVLLNFTVVAGAVDTAFTINSAILPFPAIIGEGTATAAVTVTDNDGDGAVANGSLGTMFYQATYNGGTNFWTGVNGPVTADPYTSKTASGNVPPWQYVGYLNQMASQFSFVLEAGDGASGTSSYVVIPMVPEPSTFAALAFGAIGLSGTIIRRRRS